MYAYTFTCRFALRVHLSFSSCLVLSRDILRGYRPHVVTTTSKILDPSYCKTTIQYVARALCVNLLSRATLCLTFVLHYEQFQLINKILCNRVKKKKIEPRETCVVVMMMMMMMVVVVVVVVVCHR